MSEGALHMCCYFDCCEKCISIIVAIERWGLFNFFYSLCARKKTEVVNWWLAYESSNCIQNLKKEPPNAKESFVNMDKNNKINKNPFIKGHHKT